MLARRTVDLPVLPQAALQLCWLTVMLRDLAASGNCGSSCVKTAAPASSPSPPIPRPHPASRLLILCSPCTLGALCSKRASKPSLSSQASTSTGSPVRTHDTQFARNYHLPRVPHHQRPQPPIQASLYSKPHALWLQAAVEACWRRINDFNACVLYTGPAGTTRMDETGVATIMSLLPVTHAGPDVPLSPAEGVKIVVLLQCLTRLAALPAAASFMTRVDGVPHQNTTTSVRHFLHHFRHQSTAGSALCFLEGLPQSPVFLPCTM